MKTKTVIITSIFIFSAGIQLLSQIIVTKLFGASIEMANFLVAVTIPAIMVTVIYSTLNDAFLPIYGDRKSENLENDNFFASVFSGLSLIAFIVAIVLSLFSVQIIKVLFGELPQIVQIARELSWLFYSIPLAVMAALLGSWWYAHKHFIRFPVAQLAGVVTNLAAIIILYQLMGVRALVVGFLISLLIQVSWVAIRVKPQFSWKHTRLVLLAWIPLIVGALAMRSDTLLIRSFGIQFGESSLVYLNLLAKIYSVSTGLLTIGIQVLLLPNLVEYLNQGSYTQADKLIIKAKLVSLTISAAVSLSVYFFSPFVIRALFTGGKFTPSDVQQTISLLPIFVLPGIGWGISSIFFQPLLAIKKQLEVGLISVASLLSAWASASYFLAQGLGLWSITVGLCVLLFGAIVGSEAVWQYHRKKLLNSA